MNKDVISISDDPDSVRKLELEKLSFRFYFGFGFDDRINLEKA
jgi:hypothetical protein